MSASSARSAGDIGVSFVQYRLSTLACYSPADSADYAEEYSKAILFRRERQVGVRVVIAVIVVLSFWGSSASSARSAGDIGVSFVQYSLSTLA